MTAPDPRDALGSWVLLLVQPPLGPGAKDIVRFNPNRPARHSFNSLELGRVGAPDILGGVDVENGWMKGRYLSIATEGISQCTCAYRAYKACPLARQCSRSSCHRDPSWGVQEERRSQRWRLVEFEVRANRFARFHVRKRRGTASHRDRPYVASMRKVNRHVVWELL